MPDDAFAISPISARAAQPTDADYEAISSAFMETARGRWFLSEFARRNRNADTRMVLDAVARIESTISGAGAQEAADVTGILADVRAAVQDARRAALDATSPQQLEAMLLPIRRGSRVVREVAWRWREIGADGRICDLLDTHVSAMEKGCDALLASAPPQALHGAFDLIEARIDDVASTAQTATPKREPPPMTPEPPATSPAPPVTAAVATDAENAEDDAVLDMIAMEMGAPDDDDDDDDIFASTPPSIVNGHAIAQNPSLGAALLARGIVDAPPRGGRDPLAPLRRMTQAEKVAFFS